MKKQLSARLLKRLAATSSLVGAVLLAAIFTLSLPAGAASTPFPIKLLAPASGIFEPGGIAIDPLTGDVFIANPYSDSVGVLPEESGTLFGQSVSANVDTTLLTATGLDTPAGVAFDSAGDLFISNAGYADSITVIARSTTTIFGQNVTANVPTVLSASHGIITPMGMAFDAAGDLYVAASNGNGWVSVIPKASGTIFGQTVVANQTAVLTSAAISTTSATLGNPVGLSIDSAGNLFISTDSYIRVVPVATGTLYGQSVNADQAIDLSTGSTTNNIQGIVVDHNGDIFYADSASEAIGVISPAGGTFFGTSVSANTATPILTSSLTVSPQALAMDNLGNLYVSAWDGFSYGSVGGILFASQSATTLFGQQVPADTLTGFTTHALLSFPIGMARDSEGDVYVASAFSGDIMVDPSRSGSLFGQTVTAGVPVTLTASEGLYLPQGLAVDAAGDLYVTSQTTGAVEVLAPEETTLFGQQIPADTLTPLTASTGASNPVSVAVDSTGDLIIGEAQSGPNIDILAPEETTLFGQQIPADTLTTLPASGALPSLETLTLDATGRLFIGGDDGTVWVISSATGTVFGTSVTSNQATQIDDGISGSQAQIITGLSVDPSGILYVSALTQSPTGAGSSYVGAIAPTATTALGQSVPANTLTQLTSTANISLAFGVLAAPDGSLYVTSALGFWEIANSSLPTPVVPADLATTGFPFIPFLLLGSSTVAVGFLLHWARRSKVTPQSTYFD